MKRPSNYSNTNRSMSAVNSSFVVQRRNFSPIGKIHKRSVNMYPQGTRSSNTPMEEFKIFQIVPNIKQRSSKKPRSYLHSRINKKDKTAKLPLREEMKIMIQKRENTGNGQENSKVLQPGEIKV